MIIAAFSLNSPQGTLGTTSFTRISRGCHVGGICHSFVLDPVINMIENTVLWNVALSCYSVKEKCSLLLHKTYNRASCKTEEKPTPLLLDQALKIPLDVFITALLQLVFAFLIAKKEDLLSGDWIYLSAWYWALLLDNIQSWCYKQSFGLNSSRSTAVHR